MSKVVVSKRIYEMLVKHLTKIEEEKLSVIEKYYPVWTNERNDFQELMDSYIKNIEDIIYNEVTVDSKAPDNCPFVIIGSLVTLKDRQTDETEEMQIVSPFMGEIDLNVDSASYLSPMGRAFLLKKINDDVKVETPMGVFHYIVDGIELPTDMF
ncbi:MAG TPA: GreA/GreB family elongation factor [Bacillota bacterium]|nr:GreA/GreB family elongation factor [Bacillota bacterium]HOR86153.1 GreA/GreB family elongation factor [Bacillota bacterium]HPL52927.1 GreA/GreB family elongation factor [Bacillota bacterium]